MKRNRLKVMMIASLFILVYALLSGCSSKGSDTNKESASPSTNTATVSAGNADNGMMLYKSNCMPCHGDGANGHNGPDLTKSKIATDASLVVKQITNGGSVMPSFKDTLTEEQIKDLAAYITEVIAKK